MKQISRALVCTILLLGLMGGVVAESPLFEQKIDDFRLISMDKADTRYEDTMQYHALYENKGKKCEVDFYVYPSQETLRRYVYIEFALFDADPVTMENKGLYNHQEYMLWTNTSYFISVQSETDWNSGEKNPCNKVFRFYLLQYPSDIREIDTNSREEARRKRVTVPPVDIITPDKFFSEPTMEDRLRAECPADFKGYDPKSGLDEQQFKEVFAACYPQEPETQSDNVVVSDEEGSGGGNELNLSALRTKAWETNQTAVKEAETIKKKGFSAIFKRIQNLLAGWFGR